MKKLIQVGVALFLMIGTANAQAKKTPPGPLDKKSYSVEITENGKKKPETVKDELKFASGKFQCKLFMEEGFKPTAYEAVYDSSASPVTCTVTIEGQGEKELVFTWEATITDDTIEGTATLTKKGKQKAAWTYTGTLKGKKVKK